MLGREWGGVVTLWFSFSILNIFSFFRGCFCCFFSGPFLGFCLGDVDFPFVRTVFRRFGLNVVLEKGTRDFEVSGLSGIGFSGF